MVVKSLEELKRKINSKVEHALVGDVRIYTSEHINDRIKKDVYDAYKPIEYKRSYKLYDGRNHRMEIDTTSESDKIQAKYFHRAYTEDGKNLSNLIVLGQAGAKAYGNGIALYSEAYIKMYKLFGGTGGKPFYEPRDFIGNAKKQMSKQKIAKIIEKEFR